MSNEMTRRNWIAGVVTSVVGAQLVIASKARAEGIIMPDTDVQVYKPEDVPAYTAGPGPMSDVYVRNCDGTFAPIGYIRSMNVSISEPITAEFSGEMFNVRRTRSDRHTCRIEGDIYLFDSGPVSTAFDFPIGRRGAFIRG